MLFKRSHLHYGQTEAPVTPYQKAAQVWDERIGSARVQARNWRLLAFGCLGLVGRLEPATRRAVHHLACHTLCGGSGAGWRHSGCGTRC